MLVTADGNVLFSLTGMSATFVWEFKQGFVKTDISIAVHLQEFPLRELPLHFFQFFIIATQRTLLTI